MKKVVIVGGGFSGIETAIRLRNLNSGVEIILINEDDCFSFVPSLYETAAGELSEGDVCLLISRLISRRNIIYYHDKVEKINLRKRFVSTKNLECIEFDYLVLAVGAETNYYGIGGAEKFLMNLKTKDDAQRIYEKVNNILESRKKHDFAVCGGGLTGIEFAGTLADHIHESSRKLKHGKSDFNVCIVQGAHTILPGLPDKAIRFATNYLKKRGVKIYLDSCIVKVGKNTIYTKDRKRIHYDTAVWAGGIKTHRIIAENKIRHSDMGGERALPGGGMLVNDYLQLVNDEHVFGAGDCICPINPKITPIKTAQNAVDMAKVLSYNIDALLRGKKMKKYLPINNMFYISVGKNMGMYVFGNTVRIGKEIKAKKDILELSYVDNLRKGKLLENNIYC